MTLKMNHRSGVFTRRLAALLAASVGASVVAHAGGHGEKIEFSEPTTPITTTASNLTEKVSPGMNRLNPAPSAFKQVQEDLFRPLANSLNTVDSMQGVMSLPAPPQPRAVPTKHQRQLMDQRKNWAFTDLNDLYPDASVEESLGVNDPEADKDKNAKNYSPLIEKYFNRLGQKGGTNRIPGLDPDDSNPAVNPYSYSATNRPTAQPFAAETDPTWNLYRPRGVPNGGDTDVAPAYKSQSPFSPPVSADELQAAQKRMEDFKRLLDHGTPPATPGNAPANSLQ
jgi:hypothetical protein